jgi:DNA-binding IclR family transcriptional regulator
MTPERDTSIRRGLGVLLTLAEPEAVDAGGLGVVRIAELVGKDKSQVSRSLKILAEYGFVDRDPRTLLYRLGWRFYTMADLTGNRRLLDTAAVHLSVLVEQLSESVYLSALNGHKALTVLVRKPDREVQVTASVGRRVPLHATSVGRVFLAGKSDREIRSLHDGMQPTTDGPNALQGIDDLLTRVATVRAEGYCVVDGEFEPGLISVAAPVTDRRGAVVAAVNASGPSFRFASEIDKAARAVVATAAALSADLAGPEEP